MSVKDILLESQSTLVRKKILRKDKKMLPQRFKQLLAENQDFAYYVDSLSEGLDGKSKREFKQLSENVRETFLEGLLENSTQQLSAYEMLSLPVLRVYWPNMVARQAITSFVMDGPEVIKPFMRTWFHRHDQNLNTAVEGPVLGGQPTRGDAYTGIPTVLVCKLGETDVFADDPAKAGGHLANNPNLSALKGKAYLEKDQMITTITIGEGEYAVANPVTIRPTVDGAFASTVNVRTEAGGEFVPCTVSGKIDYMNGIVKVAVHGLNDVEYSQIAVTLQGSLSLEHNTITTKVKTTIEKLPITAVDYQLETNWTLRMKKDMQVLYDLDFQSEIVSIMADQIQLDNDVLIINDLINACTNLNPASHQTTFYRNPPSGYQHTQKLWWDGITTQLATLSAVVYDSTQMGSANVILANPLDAVILEATNSFAYVGDSVGGGKAGFQTGTLSSGKWKVLVSSVVPAGKMIVLFKPEEESKSVYFFGTYIGSIVSPYPLGNIPSLSILHSNGRLMVRNQGIAILNINNTGIPTTQQGDAYNNFPYAT